MLQHKITAQKLKIWYNLTTLILNRYLKIGFF